MNVTGPLVGTAEARDAVARMTGTSPDAIKGYFLVVNDGGDRLLAATNLSGGAVAALLIRTLQLSGIQVNVLPARNGETS